MFEDIERSLLIGFMDFGYEVRYSLFFSDLSKKAIASISQKKFGTDYSREIQQVLNWLEKTKDAGIVWQFEDNFPKFQNMEKHLPFMLFYEGCFPVKNEVCISVVGTRHPDYCGYKKAFQLGYEIAANKLSLVSGLAEGCDQAATEGAVRYGGKTSSVIGCGLNVNYPKFTTRLKREIKENGGGIISRFAPDTPPLKLNFPNRNQIIAAMGYSCIIVQAPEKSGALITGEFAIDMGKDLFVSDTGIGRFSSRTGTSQLYENGCPVISSLKDFDNDYRFFLQPDEKGPVRFSDSHYILKRND